MPTDDEELTDSAPDAEVDTGESADDDYAVEPTSDEPVETPFVYDEDSLNLCEVFDSHPDGQKAIKALGQKVVDDFDNDFKSSAEWRNRVAEDWKLFAGELPPKDWPYKNAANVHVPIMMENITRVTFRAVGELFGDTSNVFGVSALGPEDEEQATLLGMHGNWQLRNEIPDFYRQMQRALLNYFSVGDVTMHSFYDEARKQNRHEVLTADEFVIPYVYTTTMPDYSDVPHMTKVVMKYRHEIEAMRAVWFDVDALLDKGDDSGFDSDPEQPVAQSAAETVGQEIPTEGAAPRKILWYEGWVDLPNQTKQRFVQAIVDYDTRHILRLTIHEEAPWQEKAKYKRQVEELAGFRAAQQAHQQALDEHTQGIAQLGQSTAEGSVGPEQAAQTLQTMRAHAPQPPPAPAWMEDPNDPNAAPKQPDKRPIHLFTHAVCIEPARGSLGLGYGRMQADANRAANTAMSQFIDSATLANCKTLVTAGNFEWEDGFKLQPGAINRIKGCSPSEMKEGILPFAFADANPALLQVVQQVMENAESSIQGPAVLSGESGKSGETARGISARIEQATKQLSVVTAKFAKEGLTPVLKNNAYLNSIFLPEDELFQMEQNLIPVGMKPPFRVSREMYERNYQIEIRADLRFATQAQRVGEADDALNLVKGISQLQGDTALYYQLARKCLEARGLRDLVTYLGPPPPVPPTTFGAPPPPPPPPPGAPPPGVGGPPGPGGPPSGMVPPGGPPNGPPPGMPPRPPPQLPGGPPVGQA